MHPFRKLAVLRLAPTIVAIAAVASGQEVAAEKRAMTAQQSGATTAGTDLPPDVFAPSTVDPAKEAEAAQKKQQRLQKIQQLTFDRRPSAILKAWATPREEALKEAAISSQGPAPQVVTPGRVIRRVGPNGRVMQVVPGGEPPGANAGKPDSFDSDLRAFQRDVTLGEWASVKKFLASLDKEEGKAAYGQLIQALAGGQVGMPGMMPGQIQMINGMQMAMQPQQIAMERNVFNSQDIIGLAWVAPGELDRQRLEQLGQILRQSIDLGNAVEDFIARARLELKKPGGESVFNERQVARLLFGAGSAVEAGQFLPTPDKAAKEGDREGLNLLARHFLALHDRDKKAAFLEQAWNVTQEALATGKVEADQKDEAIRRAVELSTKVKEELGRSWLEASFSQRPDRGMEILAAIGAATAQGPMTHPHDTDHRTRSIELQKLAVETLLRSAPLRGKEWASSLTLLAECWLKEAEFSHKFDFSTSLGPRMQYDSFGNIYYSSYDMMSPEMMMQRQGNMPRALLTGDVVKSRPSDAWLALLDEGIRPRFATVFAQLFLKVNEEEEAFPFIEQLSKTHPRQAKELAEEFLRTWTKNHDPNSQQLRRSRFFYVYGFESRAEGIPLTRSKQERNLVELSDWIKRLRRLPIGELDEKLLTGAFTACHSSAEVYRLDAINRVFGSFDALKPNTLAELIQQMRGNLIGVWRRPDEQEKQKTKRREKDIRAEVLRGYEVARAVVDQGLKQHPDHWALVLARATILHDENNYRQQLEKSPEYAPRRQEAFGEFRRAAKLYSAAAPSLPEDEQNTQVYEFWFGASLGACDLQHITEETLSDDRQFPLIRQSLQTFQGEDRERHLGKFANTLFTRLNVVKPSIKVRYLKNGFEIVGDHPQAHDARKVYDYYKDLVTEIKLETKLDGSDTVGHEEPFGVFVNIRHTREIERESGGFGRYLQNQNNSGYSYYNFGRPLENYRDKFQDIVKQAMAEQFEVLSVTFQDEKVNSKATADYGWRVTPYAYLLLRAKGPKVDRIPPVRLDLDFMDTSGFVILPVESPPLPVDATPARGPVAPFEKLQVVQTLDERQAKEGKLILEVKATALGLVPDLETILEIGTPGFEVEKAEDQGLSVSKFDPDSEATMIDSERSWLVHFRGLPYDKEPPRTFKFAIAKADVAEMVHQRYVDADLAKVGPVVDLEARYGEQTQAWLWWLAGGLTLAALAIGVIVAFIRSRPREVRASRYQVPAVVTPFSVLGLLREIERHNGLPGPQLAELSTSIQQLERHYFAGPNGNDPDLRRIAESWVARAT